MPYPATVDSGLTGLFFNVRDGAYGAKGDGVTDDTAAITAAITAAAVSGGVVFFPPGIYITGTQTLTALVNLQGSGIGVSTLRLKNGANTDLLSAQTGSINLSAVFSASSVGTLLSFSIQDLTLDGNKANQTAGPSYPLRFYGYNFIIRDVEILNGYTGGALIDWNGGSSLSSPSAQMESLLDTVKIHDSNGIGLQMGGPHDSKLRDVIIFLNGSHNFHFAPNALGALGLNCHGWGSPNTLNIVDYLVEASGCQFTNCVAEGSFYVNVAVIAAQFSWVGGSIYGTSPAWTNCVGIQLGQQAGNAVFPGQIKQSAGLTTLIAALYCRIDTQFYECRGGALNCANEGHNIIIADVFQTVGTALVGNYVNKNSTSISLVIDGLTTDNTLGKSGGMNVQTNGSTYAFTVTDLTNGQCFVVDNFGNVTARGGFNTGAGLYLTATNVPAALVTGGTINAQGVPNIAVAPTADVTGVILQAGYPGQLCIVSNASAFTVTFAASGTSHVAAGTASKISPNTACLFYYNNNTSLWGPTAYAILPVQSLTAVALATSGAITTTDLDISRVSPTSAVTGITIQAGIYPGQRITVINEAALANTITFNTTPATANVASSGSEPPIAGGTSRVFTWDSSTSLWYAEILIPVVSATAVAIITSGAIATAGLDISRVAPAGAVTGITLNVGTYMGQTVTVLNESIAANSITLNTTPATSHVADSATEATIAGTTARTYKWNTNTSFWYLCR